MCVGGGGGVCSLLPWCGFWGWSSGQQAWVVCAIYHSLDHLGSLPIFSLLISLPHFFFFKCRIISAKGVTRLPHSKTVQLMPKQKKLLSGSFPNVTLCQPGQRFIIIGITLGKIQDQAVESHEMPQAKLWTKASFEEAVTPSVVKSTNTVGFFSTAFYQHTLRYSFLYFVFLCVFFLNPRQVSYLFISIKLFCFVVAVVWFLLKMGANVLPFFYFLGRGNNS